MVWESRAVSFMSQVWWYGTDFLPQAIALDNTFLLHHAAVHTVAAGGRALLASNRTLFPGRGISTPRSPRWTEYRTSTVTSLDS